MLRSSSDFRRERIDTLISSLSSGDYQSVVDTDNEYTPLQQAALDFLDALGYPWENVFLDLRYETNPRAINEIGRKEIYYDVVVADSISAPPYLTIKTFSTPKPEDRVVYAGTISTGAKYTLGLSEEYLIISKPPVDPLSPGLVYNFSDISDEELQEISELLTPPDNFPTGKGPKFPPGHHPDQTKLTRWLFADSDFTPEYTSRIQTPHFEIDIEEYTDLLYGAYTSDGANEKGDTLEDVAEFLFEGMKDVTVRDRNLRTQSREIDLVLEHTETQKSLFSYYSRFVLVECKNKSQSMSVGEVDKFMANLRDTGAELGIIISWNGISGEDDGTNAMRATKGGSKNVRTISLSSRDLYRVLDGKSFYEIIDDRLYAHRFDL
jgi:hypothetical protein